MKKLLVFGLFLNVVLFAARSWQELPLNAQEGGAANVCTRANGDVDANGALELADAVKLLSHLFLGSPTELVPVCDADGGGGLTPEQAEILSHMSVVELPVDERGGTAKTVRFTGVNVQIVNSAGIEGPNSLGNLIVGHNRETFSCVFQGPCSTRRPRERTGSHNIIVGEGHNYTNVGGFLAGFANTITGAYASVSGGGNNVAAGDYSSVTGGGGWPRNAAVAEFSTVSGGQGFTAERTGQLLP